MSNHLNLQFQFTCFLLSATAWCGRYVNVQDFKCFLRLDLQVLVHQLIANEDIRRQVDQALAFGIGYPSAPCSDRRSPKHQRLLRWQRRRMASNHWVDLATRCHSESQDPQPQSLSFTAALKVLKACDMNQQILQTLKQDRVNRPRKHAEEQGEGGERSSRGFSTSPTQPCSTKDRWL